MFSKVLIPVDGSDNSSRALDAALSLSEKLGEDYCNSCYRSRPSCTYSIRKIVKRPGGSI